MSDAMWDLEYDMAEKIYREACDLARLKGVKIPEELKLDVSAPRIEDAKKAFNYVSLL